MRISERWDGHSTPGHVGIDVWSLSNILLAIFGWEMIARDWEYSMINQCSTAVPGGWWDACRWLPASENRIFNSYEWAFGDALNWNYCVTGFPRAKVIHWTTLARIWVQRMNRSPWIVTILNRIAPMLWIWVFFSWIMYCSFFSILRYLIKLKLSPLCSV